MESYWRCISFLAGSGSFEYGSLILMLILVLVSGFFSASETAISYMNKVRIKILADDGKKSARKLIFLSENYNKTISTLLVGNNLLNIAVATIAVRFFVNLFEQSLSSGTIEIISLVSSTVLVLLIGEFLPKAIAKENADFFALKLASVTYFCVIFLTPITAMFMWIRNIFSKNKETGGGEIPANEDELEAILDSMEEKGILESDETELIHCVLTLNDKTVSDIMIPRVDMVAVNVKEEIENVKKVFFEEKYSRIPVYSEDKDNVVGVLSERDFFTKLLKNQKFSVKTIMRPIEHVPATMKVDALIQILRKNKAHIAIVTDEFGGTDGLVTMEDALEEIVGEIYDEHDEQEVAFFQEENKNEYLLDADLEVDELFERLDLNPPVHNQFQKLTGWLMELAEEFPKVGTKLYYQVTDNYFDDEKDEYMSVLKKLEFEILEISERRIKKCRLKVTELNSEES